MRSDEDLRAAYQARLTRPADRRGCPAPEAIDALAAGEGAEAERLATLNHVMACADCRREFEQFRALAAAGRPAPPVRRWIPAAAAAAALLVLGGLWFTRSGLPRPEPVRGGGEGELQLIGPSGAIAAPEPFRWHAMGAGTHYRFELLDADGSVKYAAEQTDTILQLPDTLALPPGREFRWWVRALGGDQDGRRSPLFRFTIHAP